MVPACEFVDVFVVCDICRLTRLTVLNGTVPFLCIFGRSVVLNIIPLFNKKNVVITKKQKPRIFWLLSCAYSPTCYKYFSLLCCRSCFCFCGSTESVERTFSVRNILWSSEISRLRVEIMKVMLIAE